MKVRYKTTRETATVLKEWAANCGSSVESLAEAGMGGWALSLQTQRSRPVEEFMAGEIEAQAATPEAVLMALGPRCRVARRKTIAKLAPTIQLQ